MIVGIVARPIIMPMLAPAVVFVGMFTVVVSATPAAAMTAAAMTAATVTVGMNRRYVESKNRQ
jgi:hypothetical protein